VIGATGLLAADISVGDHITRTLFGLTFNVDTVYTTAIAGAIVCIMGLLVARSASSLVPGKLQIFYETVVDQVEDQVGMDLKERAPFVVPLAITIFLFILTCNWLAVIPSGHKPEFLPPPTADVNLTYALGLIVVVWSISTGIRQRGLRTYLRHLREPYVFLLPINILEELIKPFTLALRLFGNIFAGTVMLLIFTLMPAYILWLPNAAWKLFDLAIGLIQAFIFALLTILYFGSAIGPKEAH
jgi:F-type H+-transporting ATPase subunit a